MADKVGQLKLLDTQKSLKDLAFQAIKEAIMYDNLQPGRFYTEPDIAQQLGISRTPVHEALLELSARGFLKLVPRKGFRINELKAEDIHNLYSLRAALETAVVRQIAANISETSLARLARFVKEQKQEMDLGDWLEFLRIDRKLHQFMASLTHNNYLMEALENVRDILDWTGMHCLAERSSRAGEVLREHDAVIARLRAGDGEGAAAMIEKHLATSEKRIVAYLYRT